MADSVVRPDGVEGRKHGPRRAAWRGLTGPCAVCGDSVLSFDLDDGSALRLTVDFDALRNLREACADACDKDSPVHLRCRVHSSMVPGSPQVDASAAIRAATLDLARQAVLRDRAAMHGAPEDTFGLLAALWRARLGVSLSPAQVAIMLIDLKTARAWGNPVHADNWVDMAGYAACGAGLAGADPVEGGE